MIFQGVPVADMTGILTGAERLTLIGALVAAVSVLWRTTAKKDDQLMEMSKTVTAALTTSATSNQELRAVIQESVATKRELAEAIHELSMELKIKPCLVPSGTNGGKLKEKE